MIEIVKKIKIYDFKELDQNIQEKIINDFKEFYKDSKMF